jgi:hypothetical protein
VSATASVARLGELAAEQLQTVQRNAYRAGLADGTLVALDHIEGNPGASALDHIEGNPGASGQVYSGPMPAELRAYLALARDRVEARRG